jgi:hypothetical protein
MPGGGDSLDRTHRGSSAAPGEPVWPAWLPLSGGALGCLPPHSDGEHNNELRHTAALVLQPAGSDAMPVSAAQNWAPGAHVSARWLGARQSPRPADDATANGGGGLALRD